jgi:hypothetical protein
MGAKGGFGPLFCGITCALHLSPAGAVMGQRNGPKKKAADLAINGPNPFYPELSPDGL